MITGVKRLLAPFRPHLEPSFLIIGAQKAGTSALFKMLARHPQVLAPTTKELHFFDNDDAYAKGWSHYRRLFPVRPLRGDLTTFEATPAYLYAERAPERIHRHLPGVRMVAVLRDPVRRAYSAWNMFRSFGPGSAYAHLHDPRSFEQAVEDELRGRTDIVPYGYLARGHYARQLQRYFSTFGREPLLLLKYPDLRSDPASVLSRTCAHVGLAPHTFDPATLSVKDNVRAYGAPLDPALADRLYAHFEPHRRELMELLGADWDLNERQG